MKAYLASSILLLISLFPDIAHADGMFEQGWRQHHMFGGGGWFMWLFWIILIGVVIYFLVEHSKKQGSGNNETALDILLKRYAKGEISREEFEQMKQDLHR